MRTSADDKPHHIFIEGNIGAGKSTFLKKLEQNFSIKAVFEPHEKWQKVGASNNNLLENFYRDSRRWAYTFQSYAFITRIIEQEKNAQTIPGSINVMERSVYSDRYCFAKNCFEYNILSPLEWQLYQEWFAWLTDKEVKKPSGFIYLRTNPEVCYERIKKRERSEETAVSLDYLKALHDKHEEWLIKKNNVEESLCEVPVLVLECNEDFETNPNVLHKHYELIMNFLNIFTGKK